jgi:hypothetical protein
MAAVAAVGNPATATTEGADIAVLLSLLGRALVI